MERQCSHIPDGWRRKDPSTKCLELEQRSSDDIALGRPMVGKSSLSTVSIATENEDKVIGFDKLKLILQRAVSE